MVLLKMKRNGCTNGATLQNVLLFPATAWLVTILFKNPLEFKIHDEVKDTLGNYIILEISIQDYRKKLAAVFGLNEDKLCFFETLQSKIYIFLNSIGM